MNNQEQVIPPVFVAENFKRRLQFQPLQLTGIILLMLLPALALLGVFGQSSRTTSARASGLEMFVEYPTRFRYKTILPLEVSLKNTSAQPIPVLTVAFARAYISGFSQVQFTPQAKEVTATDYRVELTDIRPGETQRISVSLQAERYGQHQGRISASPDTGSGPLVAVSTFVLP